MAEDKALSAPATYKQPSRKGKKAWRKNVDISQIQHGLDEVREEIILGGVVAEKESNELFATDTIGDEEIATRHQGKKTLKADEILALRSAVPGVEGRKKRKIEESTNHGSSKRVKNGTYVSHKDLLRLRAVADGQERAQADEAEHTVHHDPWTEPEATKDARFSFLDETRPKVEPKTLKHAPKPLTENGKRVPNVVKPDAGKSYNPLVGDWSALILREGAAAVDAERARLHAAAAVAEREVRAAEEAARVEAAERDKYATDYDSTWESEWEGFQSEGEQEVWTQKQRSRKTAAERKKAQTRKEREAKEKMEKNQKEKDMQEKRIDQIAKDVSAKDKARRAHVMTLQTINNTASDSEDDDQLQLQRPRFGRLPVPEAPLEVVLPEELEDSLRRLKPEGNLLTDRYRNMLINGKVEVRRRRGLRKQVKTTKSEKWSYKDWKLR